MQEKDVSAPSPHLKLLVAHAAACTSFSCFSICFSPPAHIVSFALIPDMPYAVKYD